MQDPELLPRIDVLTAEDAAIEVERGKLSQSVARLARHIPRMQPEEVKALKYAKPFVDEATAFIVRIRQQAVGVQTRYVEAFNRDHGAVD